MRGAQELNCEGGPRFPSLRETPAPLSRVKVPSGEGFASQKSSYHNRGQIAAYVATPNPH